MSIFGIMFGARHLNPSERHEGMVAAVALESIAKLVAFLAVGIFVTFVLNSGFSGIFSSLADIDSYRDLLTIGGGLSGSLPSWFSTTVYSMFAVILLPRQFHLAVDDIVIINVQDFGPGIEPGNRSIIFERFGRVGRSPESDPGGTGLGLFFSKQIVEHHGGRIWVESVPGEGATFSFTTPISSESLAAQTSTQKQEVSL